jgi:DNA polymerase (family 10)
VKHFLAYPLLQEKIAAGGTRAAMRLKGGFQVDLRVVPREDFGAALLYFTGSKEHNVMLRAKAKRLGLKLNEYGIYRGEKRLGGRSEEEIYKVLGMEWLAPEKRE